MKKPFLATYCYYVHSSLRFQLPSKIDPQQEEGKIELWMILEIKLIKIGNNFSTQSPNNPLDKHGTM